MSRPTKWRSRSANALDLFRAYDVILDGTDNFPTRYLVNDACVLLGKPNVYGSIFRFEGQASVFATKGGPCYRCLYPEPPPPGLVPSCAEAGVLGVLPGIIGTIQATEAIKLILGDRRAADRPVPDLRRAADALPRDEAAPRSRVPRLRRPSDRARAHRLRAVLRRAERRDLAPAPEAPRTAEDPLAPSATRSHPRELKAALDRGDEAWSSSTCANRRSIRSPHRRVGADSAR